MKKIAGIIVCCSMGLLLAGCAREEPTAETPTPPPGIVDVTIETLDF